MNHGQQELDRCETSPCSLDDTMMKATTHEPMLGLDIRVCEWHQIAEALRLLDTIQQ